MKFIVAKYALHMDRFLLSTGNDNRRDHEVIGEIEIDGVIQCGKIDEDLSWIALEKFPEGIEYRRKEIRADVEEYRQRHPNDHVAWIGIPSNADPLVVALVQELTPNLLAVTPILVHLYENFKVGQTYYCSAAK